MDLLPWLDECHLLELAMNCCQYSAGNKKILKMKGGEWLLTECLRNIGFSNKLPY
jgi:hypothetical protein